LLIQKLKDTNVNSAERSKLIKEINATYGTTFKNIKDESLFQDQLNISVKEYIALQVLNQSTANRFQSLVVQQFDENLSPAAGAITALGNNMDTILSIIANGFGAAPTPTFGTGIYEVVVSNGNNGYVDQGAPGNNDIIPAKVIVGINSNAYASIVKYTPGNAGSGDTIYVRLTKPGFFAIGEQIEFGETVKDINITIFVESGIYYEDYPIRLAENVSIKGNDFRRTIIRPRDRVSQSVWARIFFYRDAVIDGMQIGYLDETVDYATDTSASISDITGSITITLTAGVVPGEWVGRVFKSGVGKA
jgi:hypothetical protein